MSENKKYYWIKLKENFFEDDTISFIEEQENGTEYCLFYLKLCLKSLQNDGILIRTIGDMLVPYSAEKLAEITKTNVDTVRVAIELFKKIGLIEILDSGAIYIKLIKELAGSETRQAEIMRRKRAKDKMGNNVTQMLPQSYDDVTETLHRDKEIEKEKENRDKEIEKENREKEKIKEENKNEETSYETKYLTLKAYMQKYFNLNDSKIIYDFNQIALYLNKMQDDVVLKAVNNAVKKNIHNTSYILTTLQNWEKEHKFTLDDLKETEDTEDEY